MNHFLAILFFCTLQLYILAGESPFSIDYALSPTTPSIHSPFTVSVKLRYPDTYQLELQNAGASFISLPGPLPPSLLLKNSSILSAHQLEYSFEPQSIGKTFIALNFFFSDHNGKKHHFSPEVIPIFIEDAPPPIAPKEWPVRLLEPWISPLPIEAASELLLKNYQSLHSSEHLDELRELLQSHSFPWIEFSIAFVTALCLLLLTELSKKWKAQLHHHRLSSPFTQQSAFDKLDEIEQQNKLTSLTPQCFYADVEAIVRLYLETTSSKYSPSSTSEELSLLFKNSRLPELLNQCSSGKFGSPADSVEQRARTLSIARQFISTGV